MNLTQSKSFQNNLFLREDEETRKVYTFAWARVRFQKIINFLSKAQYFSGGLPTKGY
jgi:hypothetical protein